MFSYFNVVHILYLLLPVVLIICLYNVFKDKSKKAQDVMLLCLVAVSASMVIYDMFKLYPSEGWKGILKNLPLFACDLNIFVLPIMILVKRKNPTFMKYVLYFVTTGPAQTMLAPVKGNGLYYFYDYAIWGTFISHGFYIVVAVLYFKFNHIKLSSREPWKIWLFMMVFTTIIHGINLMLIYTGLYPEANYFFTCIPANVGIAYRCAVLVGYNNEYIRCYFFMLIGYSGMTIMYYFIHKLLETERAKRAYRKIADWGMKVFASKLLKTAKVASETVATVETLEIANSETVETSGDETAETLNSEEKSNDETEERAKVEENSEKE